MRMHQATAWPAAPASRPGIHARFVAGHPWPAKTGQAAAWCKSIRAGISPASLRASSEQIRPIPAGGVWQWKKNPLTFAQVALK